MKVYNKLKTCLALIAVFCLCMVALSPNLMTAALDIDEGIAASSGGGQTSQPLGACDATNSNSKGELITSSGAVVKDSAGKPVKCKSIVSSITEIAMWVVGIVSVIIIIIAGIMYATAAGDESKVKRAKHVLIGGLVGLAIALLAATLANFVVDNL